VKTESLEVIAAASKRVHPVDEMLVEVAAPESLPGLNSFVSFPLRNQAVHFLRSVLTLSRVFTSGGCHGSLTQGNSDEGRGKCC